MKDLSLHVLDILENSARAGATLVRVSFETEGTWLTVRLGDNGPGLPAHLRADPTDPYSTTRRERKVGLGLSLLRATAEQAGGRLDLAHPAEGGLTVEARWDCAHADAKPLGDLAGALIAALASWPHLELVVTIGRQRRMVLDTREMKAGLEEVPLSHPAVLRALESDLNGALRELTDWEAGIERRLTPP